MKKNSLKQKYLKSPSDKVKKKLSYPKSEEADKKIPIPEPQPQSLVPHLSKKEINEQKNKAFLKKKIRRKELLLYIFQSLYYY